MTGPIPLAVLQAIGRQFTPPGQRLPPLQGVQEMTPPIRPQPLGGLLGPYKINPYILAKQIPPPLVDSLARLFPGDPRVILDTLPTWHQTPGSTDWPPSGLQYGNIGGQTQISPTLRGEDAVDVLAHEFGHKLALWRTSAPYAEDQISTYVQDPNYKADVQAEMYPRHEAHAELFRAAFRKLSRRGDPYRDAERFKPEAIARMVQWMRDKLSEPRFSETTPIPPSRADEFKRWLVRNKITDLDNPQNFYDYRGAFMAGIERDPETGHFPDTFKQHGHPTFSGESVYAHPGDLTAGAWRGEKYVTPGLLWTERMRQKPDVTAVRGLLR